MRCLWISWTLITFLSAFLCACGVLLPYWLKGSLEIGKMAKIVSKRSNSFTSSPSIVIGDGPNIHTVKQLGHYGKNRDNRLLRDKSRRHFVQSDIGIFRRCGIPFYDSNKRVNVSFACGHYAFSKMPHLFWKICLILLVTGVALMLFLFSIIFFLGFCLDILEKEGVYRSLQILQLIAGLLSVTGCVLYPLGWVNNVDVEQICGNIQGFLSMGRCHIGWAFVLTASGGMLCLVAAALPFLIPHASISSSKIKQYRDLMGSLTLSSDNSNNNHLNNLFYGKTMQSMVTNGSGGALSLKGGGSYDMSDLKRHPLPYGNVRPNSAMSGSYYQPVLFSPPPIPSMSNKSYNFQNSVHTNRHSTYCYPATQSLMPQSYSMNLNRQNPKVMIHRNKGFQPPKRRPCSVIADNDEAIYSQVASTLARSKEGQSLLGKAPPSSTCSNKLLPNVTITRPNSLAFPPNRCLPPNEQREDATFCKGPEVRYKTQAIVSSVKPNINGKGSSSSNDDSSCFTETTVEIA